MKEIDTSILNEIGLNEKEKIIYINLLKKQESSANQLAKLTKINRTTVYLELENLKSKGFVSFIIKNNKKTFSAKNPKIILEMLEEKKIKVKELIPQLELLNVSSEKPQIEVYEGKEGIKTMYLDFLKERKQFNFYILGSTGFGFEEFKYYYPQYYKKIEQLKFNAKMIANSNTKINQEDFNKTFNYKFKIKYVTKKYYSEVTTIILNNTVYMQSLKDNFYLIKITDKNLAKSYKNQFELLWNNLI